MKVISNYPHYLETKKYQDVLSFVSRLTELPIESFTPVARIFSLESPKGYALCFEGSVIFKLDQILDHGKPISHVSCNDSSPASLSYLTDIQAETYKVCAIEQTGSENPKDWLTGFMSLPYFLSQEYEPKNVFTSAHFEYLMNSSGTIEGIDPLYSTKITADYQEDDIITGLQFHLNDDINLDKVKAIRVRR